MRPPSQRQVLSASIVCAVLLMTGCGSEPGDSRVVHGGSKVVTGASDGPRYDGPLFVDVERPRAKDPIERSGAAGQVVRCDTFGEVGFNPEPYDNGPVADGPEQALAEYVADFAWTWPTDGYREAAEEPDRVLYTYDVDDESKMAVIVHEGEGLDGGVVTGWYVESWAMCDLAEFPPSLAEDDGVDVWTDAKGDRVATTVISSYQGPEHCDWQDSTFLELRKAVYVRKPPADLPPEYFDEPFRAGVTLPADAEDTGYSLGGRHLWLAADGARAYVGSEGDLESWPREARPLGCA